MTNRFEKYLTTGLKHHSSEYLSDEIMSLFNGVQDKINDYLVAIDYFLQEDKHLRLYNVNLQKFLQKVMTSNQLRIYKQLQNLDRLFAFPYAKTEKRYRLYLHQQQQRGGGGSREHPQSIMRQIMKKFSTGDYAITSFYLYLKNSLKMFKQMQNLLDPEQFVKYKDILFIKDAIERASNIISLFQTMIDIKSPAINYTNMNNLQMRFLKNLKSFIQMKKKYLQQNI